MSSKRITAHKAAWLRERIAQAGHAKLCAETVTGRPLELVLPVGGEVERPHEHDPLWVVVRSHGSAA